MKKIFFSLVALAALAACSKTEVAYETPAEIGFAPVAKNATKAAIEGTSFNTTQDLYVFANAGLDLDSTPDGVQIDECTEPYLRNVKFKRASVNDAYIGETPYYWPNVKSLSFAGYVDAGNACGNYQENDETKPCASVNDAMTTLTIANYTQPDSGNNDLMYFFTDATYNKSITGDVPVTMKHSCAWLVFNFVGDKVTGASETIGGSGEEAWKIVGVKVKNIAKTGTATLTAESATWVEGEQNVDFQVYGDETGTALSYNAANTIISSNKNVIVIPQPTTELYIKYKYNVQGNPNPIEEEVTVSLGYDSTKINEEWLPGVKYTYQVNIGAKQITIKPTSNDWTNYDTDSPADPNDVDPIEPTI